MVLLSLAAGGAAASATSMFGYNRDSWMTDIQMAQSSRFQRQNIGLSQAEMFRDDIRDLVTASVTKQSNYVLMATLILGIACDAYKDEPIPENVADYLQTVLLLCVGSSILYLVMSVVCAVSATVLATNCQRDLLVTLVRLPVDEFVAENEAAAVQESMEAFEHQSFNRIFRLPGLSRWSSLSRERGEFGSPSASPMPSPLQRHKSTASTDAMRPPSMPGSAPASRQASASNFELAESEETRQPHERPEARAASSREPMDAAFREECRRKAQAHLEMFRARESKWEILGRFAFKFGALGSSHLLHAYGYFAANRFYTGSNWGSLIAQALLVVVDAIFARVYLGVSTYAGLACAALTVGGPMSAVLAMRLTRPRAIDSVCVPLCFACHMLLNVAGCWQLWSIASSCSGEQDRAQVMAADLTARTTGFLRLFRFGRRERRRVVPRARTLPGPGPAASAVDDAAGAGRRRPGCEAAAAPAEGRPRPQDRYMLLILSNMLVIFAWFVTFVWALCQALSRVPDPTWPTAPAAAPPECLTPLAASMAELDVRWPSPRFQPAFVGCAGSRCFVANEFLVFDVPLFPEPPIAGSGGRPVSAELSVCEVPGEIVDVAAMCGGWGCGPLALLRGLAGEGVLDCRNNSMMPWAPRGAPVEALSSTDAGAGRLFTAHGGAIVERARISTPWAAQWIVALLPAGRPLAALDSLGDAILLFYRNGRVEAIDPDTRAVCRAWQVLLEPGSSLASAAVASGLDGLALAVAVISGGSADGSSGSCVVGGRTTRLVLLSLPELPTPCSRPIPAAGPPAHSPAAPVPPHSVALLVL